MFNTRESLARELGALGLRAGDLVMLHASVRAVGPVAGGPHQIHLAVRDAIGPTGTLLMYASCPEHYDEIGRGNLAADVEAELREKLPPFDPLTATSQRENGALVEFFRTYPGTRVNAHTVRFAAAGPLASSLLDDHPWDFAFGAGSALERFVERRGRILLLGADHDNVTFLHYAEHIVDIPDKRVVRFEVPWTDGRGGRLLRPCMEIDTANGAHPSWPDRCFAQIVDAHLSRTGNAGGHVGRAHTHVIEASQLLPDALDAMRQHAGIAPSAPGPV